MVVCKIIGYQNFEPKFDQKSEKKQKSKKKYENFGQKSKSCPKDKILAKNQNDCHKSIFRPNFRRFLTFDQNIDF